MFFNSCCSDKLLAALNSGVTLVMDRYAYSGAVYTAAQGIWGLDLECANVGALPPNMPTI